MMQKQKYRKKKPNGRSVKVVVLDIRPNEHGRKTITLLPGRIDLETLFKDQNLTPAEKVKNLRHLRNFGPKTEVWVNVRGRAPMEVPLNRVRLDPDNEMGERPELKVIGYGTLLARPCSSLAFNNASSAA